MLGGGVTISNVTYKGAPKAAGNFSGGGGGSLIGFDTGIVMGSGSVQTTGLSTPPCSKGVEGPNQCATNTTVNRTPGDADLTTLSGRSTFDASVLEFDLVPQFSTVQFKYVFSSDEYNEFANMLVNDTFGFLVNGQNCALVPNTATPVGVNTINGGDPLGTNAQNPQFYRNNDFRGSSINTEMDGLTVVLTCSANVNAGVTNHMKLAISDAGDVNIDSNVFVQAGSFVSPPPPPPPPGGVATGGNAGPGGDGGRIVGDGGSGGNAGACGGGGAGGGGLASAGGGAGGGGCFAVDSVQSLTSGQVSAFAGVAENGTTVRAAAFADLGGQAKARTSRARPRHMQLIGSTLMRRLGIGRYTVVVHLNRRARRAFRGRRKAKVSLRLKMTAPTGMPFILTRSVTLKRVR